MAQTTARQPPPPQKHTNVTIERVEKLLSGIYFTDANLGHPHLVYGGDLPCATRQPFAHLLHRPATGTSRPTFAQVLSDGDGGFTRVERTKSFGPSWTTHWFAFDLVIPPAWAGREVHFRWNSNSEALIYDEHGEPRQGLTGGDGCDVRSEYIVTRSAREGGETRRIYVEMAANGMFGVGDNGLINPPNENRFFDISLCELAVFDRELWLLIQDVRTLYDLSKTFADNSPRKLQAALSANKIANLIDPRDRSTYPAARTVAAAFFSQRNGDSQHSISAIGHCHIDTAWLWPYDETIRKCARSFATVDRYMDDYPELKFACSQAQQLDWIRLYYPGLFSRLRERVKQGRFIPVGGAWVEMDGNIPSGEAMARQFLYGQTFFQREFGITCKEFWLPDTFGYSAQLPQLMRQAGISRFVTQKLSWNLINKFPHNTFHWEGIDGSRVLTHFPPADTYNSQVLPDEVMKSITNFKDHGRSRESMMLFGHGDGGGGPQMVMLERMRRMQDCDGVPKINVRSPDEFFTRVEAEMAQEDQLLTWVGELYLELHRGTYTSQANNKKGNRKGELLLRNVEMLVSIVQALNLPGPAEAKSELDRLWKLLLLNQFHDVLPGSSIAMVYRDSDRHYADITASGNSLLQTALSTLSSSSKTSNESLVVMNTLSWERTSVVQTADGGFGLVTVPAIGTSLVPSESIQDISAPVVAQKTDSNTWILENNVLRAEFNAQGALISLIQSETGREAIARGGDGGNRFVLFDDIPLFWDAWDMQEYHLEKSHLVHSDAGVVVRPTVSPLVGELEFTIPISARSTIRQTVRLTHGQRFVEFATQVDWHEARKCLKVEFPMNVRTSLATYDIQFGFVQRPTHTNTSWDMAKFEVCGHRYGDLSEHGFGIALLNDCKYGYSARGNVMRLSLLRAPKAPDAECDMGLHTFTYAIMPHQGSFQEGGVVRAAAELNSPLLVVPGHAQSRSFFSLLPASTSVVIEAIKPAESAPKKLVLRLFESYGGQARVTLASTLPIASVQLSNIIEVDSGSPLDWNQATGVTLTFHAFEVKTLLVTLQE
ncbi:alpha mannosidase [Capsaspora owczarzaki ATCC 30864]|uniref:alpha mannosidase n=1 Tax=Capsaspora owczarzaki (strain ATCC 30864) TaxID=595528 RepID=UPI00035225DB|nr:alpha mannosidase [Capsaspora owczarzaki ATCC 30864]|eukprot:XP_004365158.2 alpha mannosidase [Capsaspora owczarzaki ATCC 30864]